MNVKRVGMEILLTPGMEILLTPASVWCPRPSPLPSFLAYANTQPHTLIFNNCCFGSVHRLAPLSITSAHCLIADHRAGTSAVTPT